MTIIHKYECGCIGIPIGDSGKCICLAACDRDYYSEHPLSFYIREMGEKKSTTSTPLSPDEQETMIRKIDALIADGYQLFTIATTIGSILNREK